MGIKRKILMGIIIWFGLAVIACIFIALQPSEKKEATPAVKQESKAEELPQPAFSKDNRLTEAEKLINPLIVNHTGLVRVVTNIKGERLGVAQIIKLSEKDFDSITAKNLKDFWLECNFDGWEWVWILESNSEGNTGRALQITGKGSVARYGYINAFEDEGIEFGKFHETVREFFYLSDEKDFQYYNADDLDDESLKRFKDSDLIFASKIKK